MNSLPCALFTWPRTSESVILRLNCSIFSPNHCASQWQSLLNKLLLSLVHIHQFRSLFVEVPLIKKSLIFITMNNEAISTDSVCHCVGAHCACPFSMADSVYFLSTYIHRVNVQDIIMCQDELSGHLFKRCVRLCFFLCVSPAI